ADGAFAGVRGAQFGLCAAAEGGICFGGGSVWSARSFEGFGKSRAFEDEDGLELNSHRGTLGVSTTSGSKAQSCLGPFGTAEVVPSRRLSMSELLGVRRRDAGYRLF